MSAAEPDAGRQCFRDAGRQCFEAEAAVLERNLIRAASTQGQMAGKRVLQIDFTTSRARFSFCRPDQSLLSITMPLPL